MMMTTIHTMIALQTAILVRHRLFILTIACVAFLVSGFYALSLHNRYTASVRIAYSAPTSGTGTYQNGPLAANFSDDGIDRGSLLHERQALADERFLSAALAKLSLSGTPEFAYSVHYIDPMGFALSALFPAEREEPQAQERASAQSRPLSGTDDVAALRERMGLVAFPARNEIVLSLTCFDAKLAARLANGLADFYLQSQAQNQVLGQNVSEAAQNRLATLKARREEAEARLAAYLSQLSAFVPAAGGNAGFQPAGDGANPDNGSTSGNGIASSASAPALPFEAKAKLIRDKIKDRKFADILAIENDGVLRRLLEERMGVKNQLTLETRVLPQGHARLKALNAALEDYDTQIAMAAEGLARNFDQKAQNGGRNEMTSASTNGQDQTLVALQFAAREAARAYEDALNALTSNTGANTTDGRAGDMARAPVFLASLAHIELRATVPRVASGPNSVSLVVGTTFLSTLLSCFLILLYANLAHVGVFLEKRAREQRARAEAALAALAPTVRHSPASASAFTSAASPASSAASGEAQHVGRQRQAQQNPIHPAFLKRPKSAPVSEAERAGSHPAQFAKANGADSHALVGEDAVGMADFSARDEGAQEPPQEPPQDMPHVSSMAGNGLHANLPVHLRRNAVRRDLPAAGLKSDSLYDEPDEDYPIYHTSADLVGGLVALYDGHQALQIAVGETHKNSGLVSLDLARRLVRGARTVLVDLSAPEGTLGAEGHGHSLRHHDYTLRPCLIDLLHGDARLGDIIHRDPRSRLHIIRSGGALGFARGLDTFLEALAETYAYVVFTLPALQTRAAHYVLSAVDVGIVLHSPDVADGHINRLVDRLHLEGVPDIFFLDMSSATARARRGRVRHSA